MDDQTNPSAPLLSDSAADKDLLDFSPYTGTLLDIIRDPNTEGPLVVGLFGTWGSGKTSLMKFVQDDLAKDKSRIFRLAWFDAWKYEKEDALWRALLLRVIDNLRDRDGAGVDITPEPRKGEIARLEQRLYRDVEWEEKGGLTVDWPQLVKGAATGAVKLSFSLVPGLATLTEAVKAAQGALGKAEGANELLDAFHRDVIEHHQAKLRSIEQFQQEFAKLVADRIVAQGERLVVFVDDLDRCLPEKAIEVLEAIKLFLDVKGCIFLLGLDQDVVTRGIRVKYRGFAVDEGEGNDKRIPIDGAAYLEKIIQVPFRLPKIQARTMLPFVHGLATFPDTRCEFVFADGLETNPRKVKRAINVFLFISKLAKKREIKLQPVRLAKIVVIYHSHPELYELLRLNPALLRDLETYLRAQTTAAAREAERGMKSESADAEHAERIAKEAVASPVPMRLITDSLRRVLGLLPMDDDACFVKADYDELASYFTLTRSTIAETTAPSSLPETVVGAATGPSVSSKPRAQQWRESLNKVMAEARAAQSATPKFLAPTFVRVPASEFLMGTTPEEVEAFLKNEETQVWAKDWQRLGYFQREQPCHPVSLGEFQIGKYPLTNAEYQAFVKDTQHEPPSYWSSGTFAEELAAHPVVNVNWDDAKAYCEWLTQQMRAANQLRENEIIRLPTEAEWEKAASWNDSRREKWIWPWGNRWNKAKCNTVEGGSGKTTPVGRYSPAGDSPCGAADMAGNVWEWSADWFNENYYENSLDKNPTGTPSGRYRVLRGGSWNYVLLFARGANRGWNDPDGRFVNVGFRCARSLVT